ncbi:uncharacterized protein PV09_00566 [Verruconis gallopava]|uniref:RING-type domain-containing protein n=1 Tax=Verruconis gallopava TaxID=253628 RepID=A0A0D1Z6M7_9PEZI|nr:uncharacterized protein PV09_00566 [Verruconis gallopava]KIW08607.1 hypothetical protein PV09_00566 [Verruconis gallopava]
MTAVGLRVLTLAFPDPDIQPISSNDFQPVNASLSYSLAEAGNIRTLSTTGATPGHDIDGLLYTPTLPHGTCPQASSVIPRNATRETNLPKDTDIFWVALAPWINANCTLEYLAAVRGTSAQAFMFYLLDNGTQIPPVADDPVWSLGDGGRWKTTNKLPVYAISSMIGQTVMRNLANYSGNLTTVPNGHELANEWPSMDYIRLAVELDIDSSERLPSLWIFLLIVLGILILIIAATSCTMHWVQRRRRERLRRRVARGDVDLEALGIKRLTVPQDVIDKMPLYTYSDNSTDTEKPAETVRPNQPPTNPVTLQAHPQLHTTYFSQATCPICLEDYEPGVTTVRELPCRHLFHPDCVDSFLRQNSSLCPMCKKTVLPTGYCPAVITNAMVRRERMVRRIRERVVAPPESNPTANAQQGHRIMIPRVSTVLRSAVASGRRVFSAPILSGTTQTLRTTPTTSQSLEMRTASSPLDYAAASTVDVSRPAPAAVIGPLSDHGCPPSPETTSPPTDRQGRREWARQRAVAMLRQRRSIQDREIEAEAARAPLWRKLVGKIWPGFA